VLKSRITGCAPSPSRTRLTHTKGPQFPEPAPEGRRITTAPRAKVRVIMNGVTITPRFHAMSEEIHFRYTLWSPSGGHVTGGG
jgi:hypothetical protein